MTRTRSALRDWSEDISVGVMMRVVQWLPTRLVLGGTRALALVARVLLVGRRRRTQTLVAQRLGADGEGERGKRIVAGAFRSLALNAVEPLLVERELRRGVPHDALVIVEGAEHLRAALAAGRGALLCGAHLGAWELTPLLLSKSFAPVWVVARQLDNPRLERRLAAHRGRFTRGSVAKDGGASQLVRILRSGEAIGMLLDQNAGRGGLIMDFLGAPSSHHKVAGVLARRFRAPALPVYLLREPGNLRFRLIVEAPIEADPALPPDEAERDVTARLSASLAARVRAHPEQYLWLHDRWRHAQRAVRLARDAAAGDSRLAVAQGTNGG
jgi:Kdo2-lipid IVA lauroyltransferase/acyltransferase